MMRFFQNSFLKRTASIIIGSIILFFTLNFIFPLPSMVSYSTIIYDRNGNILQAFLTIDQKWRMRTELHEISPQLKKAFIEKEDKYFYYHPGFNPVAVGRAVVSNLIYRKRTSGASTITMQVARMLEPKRRTYWHKLMEIFRAFQLEWKFSKDEILQLYLNMVPYGSNIEGVKSASVIYFQKYPLQLSIAEAATLAIIPNRPSSLRLGKNNALIMHERNKWLNSFLEANLFTKKEIDDALSEPLNVTRHEVPKLAPHLSQRLKNDYENNIKSTIDLNTQQKVEKLVADYSHSLHHLQIKNAAVLVINNQTHQVMAYVGSADFSNKEDAGQVDGIRAVRQPGSTLKPLLYGLSIDNGLLTPKAMMTDVPINIGGFRPENFDNKYNGYVTVDYALSNSLNIPAVKALNNLGKEKLIQKLINADFKQVKKDANKLGLSMILGGCGVNLEELTSLFSAFANQGVYNKASFTFQDTFAKQSKILSPSADYMITEILSRVSRPDLPVNWEGSQHSPRIAWKTGTSYGRKDAWSIGYNKKYTVGVWIGNFSGKGVAELSGANTATPLLFKIFNTIDYNSSNEWYAMPKECGIREVCSETGLIPNDFCQHRIADYFIPMVSSNKVCDNMQEVAITPDENYSYCKYCQPENGFKKKWFKIISPEMQTYFRENKIAFEPIPPHHPLCERVFDKGAPTILSPAGGTAYYIDKNEPQPLLLKCETTSDVKEVYWYINNQFYRKTAAGQSVFFMPQDGKVKISCTDDKGRNADSWIQVQFVKM